MATPPARAAADVLSDLPDDAPRAPGSATIQHRVDPSPRFTDGTTPWGSLFGQRKDRRYIGANKTGSHSVEYYQFLGYTPLRWHFTPEGRPVGEHLAGVTGREGDLMEWWGLVMMWIPLERWNELQQYGADGRSGLKWADETEQRIIKNRAMDDPLRGMSRRHTYFREQNGIEAQEVE